MRVALRIPSPLEPGPASPNPALLFVGRSTRSIPPSTLGRTAHPSPVLTGMSSPRPTAENELARSRILERRMHR